MNQLPGQVISERATMPIAESPAVTKDPLADLERLHNLKEKGAITTEEFQRMKTTLLGTTPNIQPQAATQPSTPRARAPATFCPQCGAKQEQANRFCS